MSNSVRPHRRQPTRLPHPWDSPGSLVAQMVKNLPANAGDAGDVDLIPGLGRSPGEGNGNPLQYTCLENPMDKGGWRATVHRVAKSQARRKQLSMHVFVTTTVARGPLASRVARGVSGPSSPGTSLRMKASMWRKTASRPGAECGRPAWPLR